HPGQTGASRYGPVDRQKGDKKGQTPQIPITTGCETRPFTTACKRGKNLKMEEAQCAEAYSQVHWLRRLPSRRRRSPMIALLSVSLKKITGACSKATTMPPVIRTSIRSTPRTSAA